MRLIALQEINPDVADVAVSQVFVSFQTMRKHPLVIRVGIWWKLGIVDIYEQDGAG